MKKDIAIAALIFIYSVAAAQPKAMGIRFGATGLDASYEHSINTRQFLECDLGLDYGYDINGNAGVRLAVTYNFIWARPVWTAEGCWNLYAGPGIVAGYTDDIVPYEFDGNIRGYFDNGLMVALAAQVGLEYIFDFPLALAIDVRPYFGIHVNDGRFRDEITGTQVRFGSKTGFYDNGMLGFIPSLSIRYRF